MDSLNNAWARARNIWNAIRHPSEEEMARRDVRHIQKTEHRPGTSGSEAGDERSRNQNIDATLEEFRLLVGIKQHPSFRAPHGFKMGQRPIVSTSKRSAPNMGIYTHIIDQEVKCKKNYKFFGRLINVCLGLQLIVAAALTAIGAANGSHSAVTAFGAINTVLAGVMTFLKGSGLPNRLKYFQHEWTTLREYVEQRERDIICGYRIDIQEEVEKIRKMYEAIKLDIEANTPDRFVSNARNGTNNVASIATAAPSRAPSMLKIGSETDSDAIRQSYIHAIQKPKNAVVDRITELGDAEKRLESFSSDFIHDRQRDASHAVNTARNAAYDGAARATSIGSAAVHDNLARATSFGSAAIHDNLARANSFGAHLNDDMHGLRARLQAKLREIGDLEKEIEHRNSSTGGFFSHHQQQPQYPQAQPQRTSLPQPSSGEAQASRAAAENEAVARQSLALTAEAADNAIAQRQEAARRAAVEESGDAARGYAREAIGERFEGADEVGETKEGEGKK